MGFWESARGGGWEHRADEVFFQTLELLEKATTGDARLVSRIENLISALSAPSPDMSTMSTIRNAPHQPRVWPLPGANPVLSRPHPGPLSGRRHVPKLVYAGAVPILRFKKPQSPYLSRIISDKINDIQKLHQQVPGLGAQLELARQEDQWDRILGDFCGLDETTEIDGTEPSWSLEVERAIEDVNRKIREEKERRSETAKEMYRIVLEETKLAQEEKVQRLHEKKQAKRSAKSVEPTLATSEE